MLVAESEQDRTVQDQTVPELQWGRDLLVAERVGFIRLAVVVVKLQWGRDLLVAESFGLRVHPLHLSLASMGPRLVSRGKLDALERSRERHVELQWGRDLLVAESR